MAANLPLQLTSFLGRESDKAEVVRLLSSSRLFTLKGTGGLGKTRLALEVAHQLNHRFADGVWMVDLAPLRDAALLPQTIAQALGFQPVPSQPLLESLLGYLQPKQLLLLLDNCEHLIAACAQLVQQLLSHAPELSVLATSREALAVAGEVVYPLQGLAWPAGVGSHDLLHYDAVRLFVERARDASPKFALTPENAPAVVEICRRLDGIPLALELASARVKVLTVQEIATRLENRLSLLASGQRAGLEARHLTMRAAIDWSHALLDPIEQTLFCRLAVFEGGCTLAAAEAVCLGDGLRADSLLEVLSSLVDKSLVLAETLVRSQARYRMLETLHEYALEKLTESGQAAMLRERHLELFLARAEEAEARLYEADQPLWLNWLEDEHDNLRVALAWTLEAGKIAEGLKMASSIMRFWEIRGYSQEGLGWFGRLLGQMHDTVPLTIRINALTNAAFLASFVGDAPTTRAYGQQAVALAESAGEEGKPLLIYALGGLASSTEMMGDYATTFAIQERGIGLLRQSDQPPHVLGMFVMVQGGTALEIGRYTEARAYLNEAMTLALGANDGFRQAHTLNSLGDLARCERNYPEARADYEQSVDLLRDLEAQGDLATPLHNFGFTLLHLGDHQQAHILFLESMELHKTLHDKLGMAECLVGFAALSIVRGLPAGVRWLAAAEAVNRPRVKASWTAFRLERERYLELARSKFSETEFQSEWAAGQGLRLEEAIKQALGLTLAKPAAAAKRPDHLTERELELVVLIGLGKSNGDIAQELSLSKRTVEKHVANILSKLGFTSRAQVVRWAIENRLK
ncbi:MAG: tetratricopeptide repeat protein [Meiothermus sp.]|nr:tetratricopeptide repeat protein [Meiothermus sp.]